MCSSRVTCLLPGFVIMLCALFVRFMIELPNMKIVFPSSLLAIWNVAEGRGAGGRRSHVERTNTNTETRLGWRPSCFASLTKDQQCGSGGVILRVCCQAKERSGDA